MIPYLTGSIPEVEREWIEEQLEEWRSFSAANPSEASLAESRMMAGKYVLLLKAFYDSFPVLLALYVDEGFFRIDKAEAIYFDFISSAKVFENPHWRGDLKEYRDEIFAAFAETAITSFPDGFFHDGLPPGDAANIEKGMRLGGYWMFHLYEYVVSKFHMRRLKIHKEKTQSFEICDIWTLFRNTLEKANHYVFPDIISYHLMRVRAIERKRKMQEGGRKGGQARSAPLGERLAKYAREWQQRRPEMSQREMARKLAKGERASGDHFNPLILGSEETIRKKLGRSLRGLAG